MKNKNYYVEVKWRGQGRRASMGRNCLPCLPSSSQHLLACVLACADEFEQHALIIPPTEQSDGLAFILVLSSL